MSGKESGFKPFLIELGAGEEGKTPLYLLDLG
jgi:hypothetical protein